MKGENFSGKVALVTGGARGIGGEICKILSERGSTVVVNYLTSHEPANQLVNLLSKNGSAIAHQADVTNPKEVEDMIKVSLKNYGRIDYLINNASYSSSKLWKVPIENLPLDEWKKTIDVDLFGTLVCSKAVAPIMQRQKYGKIINFSSSASLLNDPDTFAYNPAKVGVVSLTKSLARMLAPYVNVNAIAPGSIETDWVDTWKLTSQDIKEIMEATPLKRLGQPQEVAELVSYLLSERADFITGQVICIDGGVLL